HHTFVQARPGFRNRRRGKIHINVVGDEKIEVAVAIVVDKRAARIPALGASAYAGFLCDLRECAISIVLIENVLPKIHDEEALNPMIVITPDAHTLTPAGMDQAGFGGDVGEGAVAIVFEKMRRRRWSCRKTFETPSVDEKNVEPVIVVVVIERHAAAGGLE